NRVPSELQTSLARAFGERLHTAVEQVPGAVEHDSVDPGGPGVFREQLPALGRLRALVALERRLQRNPRRGRERPARESVDELRRDAAVRARHEEARALWAALHLAAHAAVAALARLEHGQARHACPPFCARTRLR